MALVNQCRFCHLKGVIDLQNDKSGEVMKKMNSVITYRFEIKDGLSSCICRNCFKSMSDAYAFQMQCLKSEYNHRKKAVMEPPTIKTSTYTSDSNDLNVTLSQNLTSSGFQVMRQNLKKLNDQIAALTQDKQLLLDKVSSLEKENGELKKSVMQYNITLPDITQNISSLLQRMEQQFEAMNTRVVTDNYVSLCAENCITNFRLDTQVANGNLSSIQNHDSDQPMQEDEENLLQNCTIFSENPSNKYFTILVPRRRLAT